MARRMATADKTCGRRVGPDGLHGGDHLNPGSQVKIVVE
jgi:hypothetical protein